MIPSVNPPRALKGGDPAGFAARRGAVIGALAGIVLAAQDWAGTFLVAPPGLGGELFLRALGTTAPVGAAAGAIALALLAGADRLLARRMAGTRSWENPSRRLALTTLPLAVLLTPAIVVVSSLLFSGGTMSRVGGRGILIAALALSFSALSWGAIGAGVILLRWSAENRKRRVLVALVFGAASFALGEADQSLFPGLYQYLHACLTAAAFAAACLAFASLAPPRHSADPAQPARGPRLSLATGPVLLFALGAGMMINLSTLDASATVRSGLFDPRASHTRSVLALMGPMLSPSARVPEGAVARAREARARRRASRETEDLPSWEGAHVLLITIDALRPDHLGFAGYERPTSPAIDRLAAESVVFERAYAQAPHSSYSLCSLMASEYLHEVTEARSTLPDATLPSALAAQGYRTSALFPLGIFHTEGEHLTSYSDTLFHFEHADTRDLEAAEKTDAAIETLREVARGGELPSFTWVHYFDVHEPYRDTHFGTSDMDRYDSEIRRVDREVERLLAATEEILAGEAIVILTADHGEEFRDHGGVYHGFTLYEEQVRVPLIVRAPGLRPRRVTAPVELVDVAPTVLEMVGVAPPGSMRGDDLRALALGLTDEAGPAYAGVGTQRMVVRYPDKLVADLRYGVLRLFDLERDPGERDNRASRAPERLEDLRGEIFAWLDDLALPPGQELVDDPVAQAMNRGRLGDQRAVPELARVVVDEDLTIPVRSEAARLLGLLGGRGARTALARGIESPAPALRGESAIALGRLGDDRGRGALVEMMVAALGRPSGGSTGWAAETPARRARAALALARLGGSEALPALPDAARDAPSRRERNEAIRQLGSLGGPESLGPLLTLFEDFRTRRPAALALGHLGDPRALAPLLDQLEVEAHANIRDAIVEGLGRLGDPRAVEPLAALLSEEATLRYTGEALVRLDAIDAGAVGGSDVGPGTSGLDGFASCNANESDDPYHFAGRTTCVTDSEHASIPLHIPDGIREAVDGVELVIRLVSAGPAAPVEVGVALDGHPLETVRAEAAFRERRQAIPPEGLTGPGMLTFTSQSPVKVDHVLLVARPISLARGTARGE